MSDYTGEFGTRSTISGDFGGRRQEAYEKGFTLDLMVTQSYQGVISGGRDQDGSYYGLAEYGITLDTGKLGWWSGGLITATAQSSWGEKDNLTDAGM